MPSDKSDIRRRFSSSDLRLALSMIRDSAAQATVEAEVVIALQKAYDRGRSEGYRSAKADVMDAVDALTATRARRATA